MVAVTDLERPTMALYTDVDTVMESDARCSVGRSSILIKYVGTNKRFVVLAQNIYR